MDKLKFIKMIVFLLTFFLLFGTIAAGMLVYKKTTHTSLISDISLNQPSGSKIDQFSIREDQAFLLIKGGQQADRIIIINLKNGKTAATIKTY